MLPDSLWGWVSKLKEQSEEGETQEAQEAFTKPCGTQTFTKEWEAFFQRTADRVNSNWLGSVEDGNERPSQL